MLIQPMRQNIWWCLSLVNPRVLNSVAVKHRSGDRLTLTTGQRVPIRGVSTVYYDNYTDAHTHQQGLLNTRQ